MVVVKSPLRLGCSSIAVSNTASPTPRHNPPHPPPRPVLYAKPTQATRAILFLPLPPNLPDRLISPAQRQRASSSPSTQTSGARPPLPSLRPGASYIRARGCFADYLRSLPPPARQQAAVRGGVLAGPGCLLGRFLSGEAWSGGTELGGVFGVWYPIGICLLKSPRRHLPSDHFLHWLKREEGATISVHRSFLTSNVHRSFPPSTTHSSGRTCLTSKRRQPIAAHQLQFNH